MGCHFLLKGIYPTQGLNLRLLHWQADSVLSLPLSHQGVVLITKKIPKTKTLKKRFLGFSGSPVVKNPPANAGDAGLIPGPGISHMPQSNQARAPRLLSLCSGAWKAQLPAHVPQLLKPLSPKACAPQLEKPPQWEACPSQQQSSPSSLQLEKSPHSNQDPAWPKKQFKNKWINEKIATAVLGCPALLTPSKANERSPADPL